MKIDLDELAGKANAVGSMFSDLAPWNVDESATMGGPRVMCGIIGWHVCHADSMQTAEHIAANSPPVTLALIARIRELEALAADLIEEIALDQPGSRRHELDDERSMLAKGVVLP
jgi:hypothetical protein